jgi:hypothetical protein
MINRIYRSKSDIENLSYCKVIQTPDTRQMDYKKIVVNKPWGYEYLMYENDQVAIWILHLNQNESTSMHCHPKKKTSLIVLSGNVICSTLEGFVPRKSSEGMIFETAVFHKTQAVSSPGALIMELETPPDKGDLVRLKDGYGRAGKEYEGKSEMSGELDKYSYVDFHGVNLTKPAIRKLEKSQIKIRHHKDVSKIHQQIAKEHAELICVLSGGLADSRGKPILTAGEVMETRVLHKLSHIQAFRDIIYLTISYADKSSVNKL